MYLEHLYEVVDDLMLLNELLQCLVLQHLLEEVDQIQKYLKGELVGVLQVILV